MTQLSRQIIIERALKDSLMKTLDSSIYAVRLVDCNYTPLEGCKGISDFSGIYMFKSKCTGKVGSGVLKVTGRVYTLENKCELFRY